MTEISVADYAARTGEDAEYVLLPFYRGGAPLDGAGHARWGMTLRAAGTMRFRWNERNARRNELLAQIFGARTPAPVELIHSKIVVEARTPGDTAGVRADGVVTRNAALAPVVTVADCVPIFLYAPVTGAFGAFHSGWKGTGIAAEGVRELRARYGARAEDICAAIGPHIGACCYAVDGERAAFFRSTFGAMCVGDAADGTAHLSLTRANLAVLGRAGVRPENITVATDCTCCTEFAPRTPGEPGAPVFGSFRRQAAVLPPELDADVRSRAMTVQAAFVLG